MKFELKPNNRNSSDEALIADLNEVAKKLGKNTISRAEYNEYGRYSEGTLRKRFGGWLNTLEKAGLSPTRQYLQDEELLGELKRVAKLLDTEYVSKGTFKEYSQISNTTTIERRFDSWSNALKRAGLKISPSGKRYSNEDFFENLLNVWTHYGRQPSIVEINKPPSKITGNSYRNRFGNWRKALEAFVERMNKEDNGDEQVSKKEEPEQIRNEIKVPNVAVEERRGVSLGLRYKVLSRDKFKCIKCGASPANDMTCRLNIDHITPFSKGGKTTFENLQTLCENCNLGKGNRHSE